MAKKTYLWCDTCRRSFDTPDAPDGKCPICGAEMKELGWITAFARGIMAQEMTPSGIANRHKALIQLVWTANGMGDRYYRALAPDATYKQFEKAVTDLVCRACEEGWVRVALPANPISASETDYQLEIDDEERFIEAMASLFRPSEASAAG